MVIEQEIVRIDDSILLVITMLTEAHKLAGFHAILADSKISPPQLVRSLLRLLEGGKIRYESRRLCWFPT